MKTDQRSPMQGKLSLLLLASLLAFTFETSILAKSKKDEAASDNQVFWQRVAFIGSAEVKDIKGRAEYLTPDGAWAALANHATLSSGAKFRTLQNSEIVLKMERSDSLVRVQPYTVVRLAPLEKDMDLSSLTGKEETEGFAVRDLRGRAQFRSNAGAWTPLKVNTMLAAGTEVKTDADSTLTIFNSSTGLVLRVTPNSTARLEAIPVALAGQVLTNKKTSVYSDIRTAGISNKQ